MQPCHSYMLDFMGFDWVMMMTWRWYGDMSELLKLFGAVRSRILYLLGAGVKSKVTREIA